MRAAGEGRPVWPFGRVRTRAVDPRPMGTDICNAYDAWVISAGPISSTPEEGTLALDALPHCRTVLIGCSLALGLAALPGSAWALPSISVPVTTSALANFGAHRATTITGANATQEVNAPTITTASCAAGNRLVGGGAVESTPGQVNDGTTVANSGNLKPLASYPSNSSGAPATNSSTNPTSWSAYGSSGIPATTDQITAFAICSTDMSPPTITVNRTDSSGANGQAGTTVTTATASCASGRMMSGGYRVDETVGSSSGLQPQQGYHMRGSYPVDGSGNEVANGATNPNSWKTVLQAGGQTLGVNNHMDTKTFALCSA